MSVLTMPTISATLHSPFGLSLPFDGLRMIGNTTTSNTTPIPFGLSLSKPCLQLQRHFDKLNANGFFSVFQVLENR